MKTIEFRPYQPTDADAVAEIYNSAAPGHRAVSTEQVRFWEETRDPKCRNARWVKEADGQPVAYGEYSQWTLMFHPRRFILEITVLPAWQRQGIGAALYRHLEDALQPFDPLSLSAWVLESYPHWLRFYQDRGFREEMRQSESVLDVTAFDFAPYEGHQQRVEAKGFRIATYQELETDPQRDRKVYELEDDLARDVPQPDPYTPTSLEYFQARILRNPDFLPDAYFLILQGEEYIGMSNFWRSTTPHHLQQGLTGVRRAYRRQGIALSLKLFGLRYAKNHGTTQIRTDNAVWNEPMLAINRRLGFMPLPAWIGLKKTLKEEE
jgi:mycothiol synthase